MAKRIVRNREGFTLIELLIVIAVIAILAAIAIPNLLSSRMAANEASAIGSIRTLNTAEATYRTRKGSYGTMTQLATASMIDPALGAASASSATAKSGYWFNIAGNSTTQYYAVGQPQGPGTSGTLIFYTDETGVIWQAPDDGTTTTAAPTSDTSGNIPAAGWVQVGQ